MTTLETKIDNLHGESEGLKELLQSRRDESNLASGKPATHPTGAPSELAKLGEERQAAVSMVENIESAGYLFAADWNETGNNLAEMNKDQNKPFWQRLFHAIEQGEIETFSGGEQ